MNRTFAVSDIHGNYNLWSQIKDYLKPDDVLYILGDCSDRGPQGWQIIKEALADPRVIYIRGNHDEMLLDSWKSEWMDTYIWFYNGGSYTFDSILCDPNAEVYLRELNKTKYYHKYINKDNQIIHLSHAGFTLMQDDVIPDKEDLIWDRDHIDDSCSWWPKTNPNDYCVHGHTPIISSCFKTITPIEINETKTMMKYCHGYKICIDSRTIVSNKICLFNLDTLQEEKIFYDMAD